MSSVDLESLIIDIPDYPEPGVIFKDITPLMADSQGFAAAIDDIADHFMKRVRAGVRHGRAADSQGRHGSG